jgi:hypothetical protein
VVDTDAATCVKCLFIEPVGHQVHDDGHAFFGERMAALEACVGCDSQLAFRVPAAAFLLQPAFLLQAREDAVEVVLLDTHLCGELGDRDTGLALDERQCLGGTATAAFGTSTTCFAFARGASYFFAGRTADFFTRSGGTADFFATCRSGLGDGGAGRSHRRDRRRGRFFAGAAWASRSFFTARSGGSGTRRCRRGAHAGERRRGGLEATILVNQWGELIQAIGDFPALCLKKFGHGHRPFIVVKLRMAWHLDNLCARHTIVCFEPCVQVVEWLGAVGLGLVE